MTSDEMHDAIETIAATSSKNEKEALVKQFARDPEFVRVLKAALDPFVTYGIAKMPEFVPDGDEQPFDEGTWRLLARLASRELTGNAAREALAQEFAGLSAKSAELLQRIIKKDLRAGFGENTANKAVPGLIPDFPYMRCSLPKDAKLDRFRWDAGVFSQEKADGMFANVDHEASGLIVITTRQGNPFPLDQLGELEAGARSTFAPGTQTHGELLVTMNAVVLAREQGNGVLNSILEGGALESGQRVIFKTWDQIPLSAVVSKGKYKKPYIERFKALAQQILRKPAECPISMIATKMVRSLSEAYAHYRELLANGKEGTIIKDPRAIWKDGTSKEQVKLKLEVDCDLKIVGFLPGNGKNAATFGSIVCRTSDDRLEVAVSGLRDATRKAIHAKKHELIGTVMTVKSNSIMNPSEEGKLHSLFLPRFVEIRKDKTEADSLQRVRDQFEAAILGEKVAA